MTTRCVTLLVWSAFAVQAISAQISFSEKGFTPLGVSNDGKAAGYYRQADSYYLWEGQDESRPSPIGGISAGEGYGGWAAFSADGRYLSGTTLRPLALPTKSVRRVYDEKYNFKSLFSDGYILFAVGASSDGKDGVLVSSTDGGEHWRSVGSVGDLRGLALESGRFINDQVGVVGGANGLYLVTLDHGFSWSDRYPKPAGDKSVAHYWGFRFLETTEGVALAEMADGSGAVFYTPNGAETWEPATGIEGHPVGVAHHLKGFCIVTREGRIFLSEQGKSWTQVQLQNDRPLRAVSFCDSKTGIAVGDQVAFRTEDGGETWTAFDPGVQTDWNAVGWYGNKKAYLAGADEHLLRSLDGGMTWEELPAADQRGKECLTDLYVNGRGVLACGSQSTFYTQSDMAEKQISEMARYDCQTGEWQSLGNLGFLQEDNKAGSGYYISADGKNVVGNCMQVLHPTSLFSTSFATATIWNEEEGLVDLGSRYGAIGRSSRADAVSEDGRVVVGWQDQRGPWRSAVWRKQSDGSWSEGQYILDDPSLGDQVEYNQMPQCTAVSPNGHWIAGKGWANPSSPLMLRASGAISEPWIWSEETGVMRLGMLESAPEVDGFAGVVKGVNNEGDLAVGFFNTSLSLLPNIYPFIWTKEQGMRDLNTYVTEDLGVDLGTCYLASVLGLSPNGRYISGWGMKEDAIVGFVIDLEAKSTHIEGTTPQLQRVQIAAADHAVRVSLPEGVSQAKVWIHNLEGEQVLFTTVKDTVTTLAGTHLAKGMYVVSVQLPDGTCQAQKLLF